MALQPIPALSPIGCKRDAIAAYETWLHGNGKLARLGAGAFRTAYRGINPNFVYKIANRVEDQNSNESEYLALTAYRTDGQTWASGAALYYVDPATRTVVAQSDGTNSLPASLEDMDPDYRRTLVPIIALRFYPTAGHDADDPARAKLRDIRNRFALEDMHGANWRVTAKGRVRVTDLGEIGW